MHLFRSQVTHVPPELIQEGMTSKVSLQSGDHVQAARLIPHLRRGCCALYGLQGVQTRQCYQSCSLASKHATCNSVLHGRCVP
jgi:hypothetical protein